MCRPGDEVHSNSASVRSVKSSMRVDKAGKPRRRVRFDDSDEKSDGDGIKDEQHREGSGLTAQEKEDMWYQPHDFTVFKQNARGISQSIRQEDSRERRRHSYTGVILRVYSACLTSPAGPSNRDQHALGHWVRTGHSRRGLERWSFPAMMSHRAKQRSEAIKVVLRLQQTATSDSQGRAEFIRQAYKLHSDPLARMAASFGEADAVAVRSEIDLESQIDQLCRQKRRLSIGHVQRTAYAEPSTTKVC